jgi:transcription elongation factor Elf1
MAKKFKVEENLKTFTSDESSSDEELIFNAFNEDNCLQKQKRRRIRGRKKSTKLGPKLYYCPKCEPNRYFKKQKVLDLHMNCVHKTNQSVFICVECLKEFETENQKLIHQTLYSH